MATGDTLNFLQGMGFRHTKSHRKGMFFTLIAERSQHTPLYILCMHGIQEGKPDGDHKSDPEGKPESTASKAIKGSVKLAAKITKIVAKNSGLVDDETADIISGVADAAENQAEAGRDATITDRLKMGGRCKLQYR